VGNLAQVTQSNSMVLGSINGVNSATADTNVGIGITAPTFKLHIGVGGNGLRVEGPSAPASGQPAVTVGGFGDFGIDAYGTASGRFVVKENSNVGISHSAIVCISGTPKE